MRSSPLARIYRLKLLLIGALLIIAAFLLTSLADLLTASSAPHLLTALVSGVADVALVTGAIGIAVDFFTGRDRDAADSERLRSVLKETAPDIRDAVITAFAETPEKLHGVATNETLDKVATNALALRLGDATFAGEIYAGLLSQAIRTPERWSDVDINVKLSSLDESSAVGAARLASAVRLFDAVVVWEYSLVPSTRVPRFAATNSLQEFREYLAEVPATSAWFISAETADASTAQAFEVLSYSVDGVELPVRRSARKRGQTYSVDLGEQRLLENKQLRIRQVYRTVVRQSGHRFRIALTQPTHGMRLVLDYTDTDIVELKVGDMLSTAASAQVKFLPPGAPAKQVEVSVPGWLLPTSEVGFVWTLSDEADGAASPADSVAA